VYALIDSMCMKDLRARERKRNVCFKMREGKCVHACMCRNVQYYISASHELILADSWPVCV